MNGNAPRGTWTRPRPATTSGSPTNTTPTSRPGRTTHAGGRLELTRPATNRPIPRQHAAPNERPAARSDWARLIAWPSSSSWPPLVAARTTPTATRTSAGPAPGASSWPVATEMTAAIAPSVEPIVDTIAIAPRRYAAYASSRPHTLATPATTVHTKLSGGIAGVAGIGETNNATGRSSRLPTSITPATAGIAPASRLERAEPRVETA